MNHRLKLVAAYKVGYRDISVFLRRSVSLCEETSVQSQLAKDPARGDLDAGGSEVLAVIRPEEEGVE